MEYFFDDLRWDKQDILYTTNSSYPFSKNDFLTATSFNPNQIKRFENIGGDDHFGLKRDDFEIRRVCYQNQGTYDLGSKIDLESYTNKLNLVSEEYPPLAKGKKDEPFETIIVEENSNKGNFPYFELSIGKMNGLNNLISEEYFQEKNLGDAFDVISPRYSSHPQKTSLTPKQGRRVVRDVLEEIIAGHYDGEVKVTDKKEIKAGRNDNSVFTYTVNGETKQAFIKQIHYNGPNARLRFQSELHLQRGLYNLGVSVAKPISALELDDRGVIVQEYVPGETLDTIAAKLTYNQRVDLIASVAKELARFQAKATLHTQELREAFGITEIVNQDRAYFEYGVQRDHARLTQSKTPPPQQLIDAGLQSVTGARRYAAHTDFNPWNVMLRDDSQVMLLDFEELALPSSDGTQGYFLGHDLANVLSWPQFQLGPIAQRDVIDVFIDEFHKTLKEEKVVDLKTYKDLHVDQKYFKKSLHHAQMYMAHWVAGIEANEGRKGKTDRLMNSRIALDTINTNERVLGYRPQEYRVVA